MMPSKTIHCEDCGEAFEWNEREQEFYASNDFSPPKRCKPCREKRKKRFAEQKAQKDAGGGDQRKGRGKSRHRAPIGNQR